MKLCACCSEKLYMACCARFIEHNEIPSTPEELMRSRYTAYTEVRIDYITQTMKSPAADQFDPLTARDWVQQVEWTALEIIETTTHQHTGFVEFIAHFSHQNKKHVLHEISEFHFDEGRWYYVEGKVPTPSKSIPTKHIGRNDTCLCGSGKKYKKCCGSVGEGARMMTRR